MAERPNGLPGGGDLRRALAPPICVLVNAIAFCLVRPGVPDLWAARARASAAAHGVGLHALVQLVRRLDAGLTTGSLCPLLFCALVGTELVAAIAAVVVSGVGHLPGFGQVDHPTAAAWMVTVGVVINLWCGRVPFLRVVFVVGSVAMVRTRRTRWASPLAVLSVLSSPVPGRSSGLRSPVSWSRRLREYRTSATVAIACAFGSLALIAILFGSPGPEPFPPYLLAESGLAVLLMLALSPTSFLRGTLVVSAVAALVVFSIPNGRAQPHSARPVLPAGRGGGAESTAVAGRRRPHHPDRGPRWPRTSVSAAISAAELSSASSTTRRSICPTPCPTPSVRPSAPARRRGPSGVRHPPRSRHAGQGMGDAVLSLPRPAVWPARV